MEEKVKISMLCEFYGKLLTDKQYEFINDYYNNDLSLSEIAENNEITRQAVRDIIKKGEKNFSNTKKSLIYEKDVKPREKDRKGFIRINKNTKDYSDKQIANVLESIKKEAKLI